MHDLSAQARTEPEAALLLRDIWEVSNITDDALDHHHPPDMNMKALAEVTKRLLRRPFGGGEEVLF